MQCYPFSQRFIISDRHFNRRTTLSFVSLPEIHAWKFLTGIKFSPEGKITMGEARVAD